MRISDWSSDVCSSDLALPTETTEMNDATSLAAATAAPDGADLVQHLVQHLIDVGRIVGDAGDAQHRFLPAILLVHLGHRAISSAARLVGKACVSTVRSRW